MAASSLNSNLSLKSLYTTNSTLLLQFFAIFSLFHPQLQNAGVLSAHVLPGVRRMRTGSHEVEPPKIRKAKKQVSPVQARQASGTAFCAYLLHDLKPRMTTKNVKLPGDRRGSDPRELGEKLHAWLTTEMRFQPQGRHCNTKVPSAEVLAKICRGKAGDIWQHVISSVHSAETVRKVKGNLMLQSRGFNGRRGSNLEETDVVAMERDALLQRRKGLVDHVTSARSATQQLEKENDRMDREIAKTENQLKVSWQKSRDLCRKRTLLKAKVWQLEMEVKKLTEYEKGIGSKADVLIHRARNPKSDHPEQSQDQEGIIETNSTKETKDSCGDITSFLQELFKGDFNTDRTLMQRRRDGLWQKVENVMNGNSPTQVVMALMNIAQENALNLRNATNKIDITEDIKRLKFKFENGQLLDEATEPSTLQSVHQLLMESQKSHFMSFVEQEKCRNAAFRYGQRMLKAKAQVEDLLEYEMRDNPGARDLARHLVALEMASVADRAALRILQECSVELQERVSKASRDKGELVTKYQKIQHFRELTNQKQEVVRVLSKQNMMAQQRLYDQQKQIALYAEKSLLHHKKVLQSTSDQLLNSVAKEVECFAKIPLPYLHFTKAQDSFKSYVMDLSIHQLDQRSDSQSQTIQRTLQFLGFKPYQAPECLLPQVMNFHRKVNDLEVTLRNHHDLAVTLEGRTKHDLSISDHISGLCDQIKESDKQQEKEVLPKLQKNVHRSTEALSQCLHLKGIIQDWWEQPAQNTVTWTRLDDCTLKQWRDRWTIGVTRLRQLTDA